MKIRKLIWQEKWSLELETAFYRVVVSIFLPRQQWWSEEDDKEWNVMTLIHQVIGFLGEHFEKTRELLSLKSSSWPFDPKDWWVKTRMKDCLSHAKNEDEIRFKLRQKENPRSKLSKDWDDSSLLVLCLISNNLFVRLSNKMWKWSSPQLMLYNLSWETASRKVRWRREKPPALSRKKNKTTCCCRNISF